MNVAHLRLAPVRETMFPSRAPFLRDRLSARGAATAAARVEDRNVACDVAEVAVPALPSRPLLQRGNLTVSPGTPLPCMRIPEEY